MTIDELSDEIAKEITDKLKHVANLDINNLSFLIKNKLNDSVKLELEQSKSLLEKAKDKLRHPGRYEYLADEIEQFLKL
jgi:hypothetical protein